MEQRHQKPLEVRQIPAYVDPQKRDEDLTALCRMAKDLGADDAVIINAGDVIIDEDIKVKASLEDGHPSIHWPLVYPKDSLAEALGAYDKGLFFQLRPPENMPGYGGGPIPDEHHRDLYFKVSDIVTQVESRAFYMGYHLVLGFAAGNCRSIFCADKKRCSAMIRGHKCLQPYKSRPSLEAIGIDAFTMAKTAKFKLPENKTNSLLAGLVMIS